jgi:hypothetical protein
MVSADVLESLDISELVVQLIPLAETESIVPSEITGSLIASHCLDDVRYGGEDAKKLVSADFLASLLHIPEHVLQLIPLGEWSNRTLFSNLQSPNA